jgi:carboxypeptidase C (cathepsin A)
MSPITRFSALVLFLVFSFSLIAEEEKADKAQTAAPPAPFKVSTQHRLKTGGADISYTANAEEIYLKDGDDNFTASFFTISYIKNGTERPEDRPITFVFNGGPGSASIWLHLGLVGPKVIDIPSDASDPGSAPYTLKDNPYSLLRATDLVFVDPVGTGFSKALGEKKNEDFWGFDEDADSVAEFIRTYITQHNRWNSPKFVLGESYGGIRGSMLVPRLQQELSIALNGLILISPALNLATIPFFITGNDLPYAVILPAMAATAYYHGKLSDDWPDLESLLTEVETYASTTYLSALFRGDSLTDSEKQEVASQLRRYTGLDTDYILQSNLRIHAFRYGNELLREEGKSIGLLDGRYAHGELDGVAEFSESDAFGVKTGPIYVASFQAYLRNDLGVDITRQYVVSNDDAGDNWKRRDSESHPFAGYIDITSDMAQGTMDNDSLRIFSAGGYHDLVTSYFATEYMLQHSGMDPAKVDIRNYEGGHMMYLYQPSLVELSDDIVEFIDQQK